jgi:hypothetical protein
MENFALRRGLRRIGWIGSGIHGSVFMVEDNARTGFFADKIHEAQAPYDRERSVYERLMEAGVVEIRDFHIPRLLAADDELLALEMTILRPPYILDFAGAWLDFPPRFSEEVMEEWRRKNQEQFGADWPMVQLLLGDLEDMGIHMLDPTPSNICFR